MFSFNVDLGQLMTMGVIAVIGWFLKKTIRDIENKIMEHDDTLHELSKNVNRLIGIAQARRWMTGHDSD